ncbi:MAG: 50S ribosomal protein L25/general stress protein Ctc [Rickettsiales bacterium]|nr:50S ribosomal protein L25/general stress protein Ctc [Rickettsiales bacterium]
MTAILSVDCEIKEKSGKGASRSLRRETKVPINIYGKDLENVSAAITAKSALEICHRFSAKTSLVELKVGKEKYSVLPKQIDLHPVTDEIIHIDFLCVKNTKILKIDVPIKVSGAELSPGIKRGGVLNMTTRFITSRVKKENIPSFIEVDISNMTIGETVMLKDLKLPQNTIPVEKNLNKTIIKVVGKKAKATDETTAATGEGAAAAEPKAAAAPAKSEGNKK